MLRMKTLFSFLVCLLGACVGCSSRPAYQTPPPPKVTTAKPTVETIPIFLEENGQMEAADQAIVQARVRGILEEIKFQPGATVAEGTPLFVIEQAQYVAAVESAKATIDAAKASLATAEAAVGVADASIAAADAAVAVAQADFTRMEGLLVTKAVAQAEFDAAKAQLETANAAKQGAVAAKIASEADVINAKAQVTKAEADLKQAELDLERTVVLATISGQITKTMVKRGNLVESGTPLVEIIQNDPIWANFNVSERFLLDFERNSTRNKANALDLTNVKARVQRSGDVGFPFEGHLDYYDPKVDEGTGTLQLRAVFENSPDNDSRLLQGLFVRVRVQVGQYENALLIPERAVSRDQVGSFVYVVDQAGKAARKNVKLGTKSNDRIVIESGLEPSDSVIVDGIQRVRTGIEVDPS